MPELVTIPNITLVEVGTWQAATGEVTFLPEHLYAAANAPVADAAIKLPRMRFGHSDPANTILQSAGQFEEQPCVGKFTNLRVENNGTKLVADLTGVPSWLAEVLPVAYPNRSVEAYFNVQSPTGKHHSMIIASVALLGENLPAVATLEDLQLLFSENGDEVWIEALTAQTKVAASQGGDSLPQRVDAASVDTDAIRTAFYDNVATEDSGRYWWWLYQIYIDPKVVIAEDDAGEMWMVPYTLKTDAEGDDPVTFGDPVQVFIQWVRKDNGQVAAKVQIPERFGTATVLYAAAHMSRPATRQQQFTTNQEEAEGTVPIDTPLLLKRLGLPDDATEEQINEALAASESEPEETPEEEPEEEPAPAEEPAPEAETETETPEAVAASGTVVDKQAWENTRKFVEAQQKKEREGVVLAAIKDRKIPPSRKGHYLALMEQDEEGTREFLSKLEKDAVPGPEVGSSEDPEASETTRAQGTGLFPELATQEA